MGDNGYRKCKNPPPKVFDSPWTNKATTGRPPKPINWKKFDKMCAEQCTKVDICLEFGFDPTTLEAKIRDKYDMSFTAVFEIKRTAGIRSLRSRNFAMAMAGSKDMQKHVYGLYAHKDENIDPRFYGGNNEGEKTGDHKIDINVSFIDKPDKCVSEAKEIDKLKDED